MVPARRQVEPKPDNVRSVSGDREPSDQPLAEAGQGPTTQVELANERTYLAWLRTGLALVAAGVAAERLLPRVGVSWVREVIGITLVLVGAVTAGFARRRWETVDRALRAARPPPRPFIGYLVATAIVVDGLAAMFLMIRAESYRP